MTYLDLIAMVPKWMYAQNRDLAAEMPKIVEQAQRQMFHLIMHDFFRTKLTSLTLPVTGVLDLSLRTPAVMEIRGIRLQYRTDSEWVPLMRRDQEMLSMLYAKNIPGRPRYYAESSGPLVLQVYPTPDVAYPMEVTCNQEFAMISPTLATNLFTLRASRLLQFATLKFAAIYMKDQAAEAGYTNEMMAAANEINAEYARHQRDDTAERPRNLTNMAGS